MQTKLLDANAIRNYVIYKTNCSCCYDLLCRSFFSKGFYHQEDNPRRSGQDHERERKVVSTIQQFRRNCCACDRPKQVPTNPEDGGHVDDGEDEVGGRQRKSNHVPVIHHRNLEHFGTALMIIKSKLANWHRQHPFPSLRFLPQ